MTAPRKTKASTATVTVDILPTGRDEMNLAEFPISVLTDRAPEGVKTLIFRDARGSLTVTGSDLHGLPTALDADVMVALIQLTKQKNDFTEATVNFTRYELIRLLGWPNEGKSYNRIDESLNRWHGVSLYYDGCWWDNRAKKYGDAKIHILESIVILDGNARSNKGEQQTLPLSSFEWNKKFMESCQADNLKRLDLMTYFALLHPSAKRLYRFLDKRFYLRPDWTFDLKEIAFERVGLSRSYGKNVGKIKEKLQPAIEELETHDFLAPMTREQRYFKDGPNWKIRLTHKSPALPAQQQPVLPLVEPPPLVVALVQRGVTGTTAVDLVQRHAAEAIDAKLEVFDWLTDKQDRRIEKNPAGYLVKSIEQDFAAPKGFTTRTERQRQEEARQAKERQAAEDRRRKQEEAAREKAERQGVLDYRNKLTADQLRDLSAKALASADEETRRSYETPGHREFNRLLLDSITDGYIRQHRLWELEKA